MKIRLVQAAALVAGVLAPWMAAGDPLVDAKAVSEPGHAVRLIKAPGDALRFRWAARVGGPGHFVLQRPDGSEVWTAAVVGRTEYEAAPPALSGEYELRYRDAEGHESVLVHVLVACVSVDRGGPASSSARLAVPDLESTDSGLLMAWPLRDPLADTAQPGLPSVLLSPPTPPPRPLA